VAAIACGQWKLLYVDDTENPIPDPRSPVLPRDSPDHPKGVRNVSVSFRTLKRYTRGLGWRNSSVRHG